MHICRLSGAVVTNRAGYSLGCSPTSNHGLWPVATQPYMALVCRFNGYHLNNMCFIAETASAHLNDIYNDI